MKKRGAVYAVGLFLISLVLGGMSAGVAASEKAVEEGSIFIRLGREHFDPLDKCAVKPGQMNGIREVEEAGPGYYIIQFDGPVKENWKAALKARGAALYDYIPDFAFVVRVDANVLETIRNLPHVRWVGEYRPSYKLSRKALDKQLEGPTAADQESGDAVALLKVIIFPGEDLDRITGHILSMNGEVIQESIRNRWDSSLIIRLPAESIEELGLIRGIKWIAPAPRRRLYNNVSTDVIRARSPRIQHQLYGEGQTIGVCDSGLDIGENDPKRLHKDFLDGKGQSRVVRLFDASGGDMPVPDTEGHGTHVSGSVLGNGTRSGSDPANCAFPVNCFSGMAPRARLVFHAMEMEWILPLPLDAMLDQSRTAGANLHTNSWGDSLASAYTSESKELDQYVWDHRDFLVFFAAGNDGVDKDADGVIDLYSMASPASAKNCLTVGASEGNRPSGCGLDATWGEDGPYEFSADPIKADHVSNRPDGMAAFSSRGPVLDGRYKPDLIAPGTNILSTRSSVIEEIEPDEEYDDYYMWDSGTSMSTPITAGMAALAREYLTKILNIAKPSAALLKAALLNGARDITPGQYGTGTTREIPNAPVPNNVEGWGRVDLENTVYPKSPATILYYDEKKAISTGESTDHHITVTSASAPLKINLAWSDYPGSEVVQGGLVNDLDLEVILPSAKIHYADNANRKPRLSVLKYMKKEEPEGQSADSMAVRFTPLSYPAHLETVAFVYNKPFLDFSEVTLAVYDDNGPNGLPGTVLFKKVFTFIPDGSISVGIEGVVIAQGDFYVAIEKVSDDEFIRTELGNSEQRSYRKTDTGWELSKDMGWIIAGVRETPPSTNFDRVNNVLGVTLPTPEVGAYIIRVSGYNVPKGPQTYALVARGVISMTSPEAGSIQFESAFFETSEYAGSSTIRVLRSRDAARGLSGGSTGELTVKYRTGDGTAEAGKDYVPVSGTLVWSDGDDSPKEFQVPILYDSMTEGDETVTLILEKPAENSWLNCVESALLIIEEDDAGGGGSSSGCFIESLGF